MELTKAKLCFICPPATPGEGAIANPSPKELALREI